MQGESLAFVHCCIPIAARWNALTYTLRFFCLAKWRSRCCSRSTWGWVLPAELGRIGAGAVQAPGTVQPWALHGAPAALGSQPGSALPGEPCCEQPHRVYLMDRRCSLAAPEWFVNLNCKRCKTFHLFKVSWFKYPFILLFFFFFFLLESKLVSLHRVKNIGSSFLNWCQPHRVFPTFVFLSVLVKE